MPLYSSDVSLTPTHSYAFFQLWFPSLSSSSPPPLLSLKPDPFFSLPLLSSWSLPLLWICWLWVFLMLTGRCDRFWNCIIYEKLYLELKNLTWFPRQQKWITERISISGCFCLVVVTFIICICDISYSVAVISKWKDLGLIVYYNISVIGCVRYWMDAV